MADFDPDSLLDRPAPQAASMRVRPEPTKLTRDEAERIVRKYNPDITKGAVQGEVDNLVRESGLNFANSTGDGGTSGGGYQHHLSRLKELKAFAGKEGKPWTDPETQVKFARLEKERDYPALLKLQQSVDDRARNEDAFKRIFERPASVLWKNNAGGQPVLGNDQYQYSDYALKEHQNRPNTDMHLMSPEEYLALAPTLVGKPFESPSGRALLKSVERGDKVESVPTLDVTMDGPTATVTDQDGRHRALLAQQNGIEAIPVAVRRTGQGDPKEIVGMDGTPQAFDHPKMADVRQPETPEQPKEPLSLMGQIGNAIMPSAAAAEVDPWAAYTGGKPGGAPAQTQTQPPADPWAAYTGGGGGGGGETKQSQPGWFDDPVGAVQATVHGAAKGLGDTALAGQELVGKGMEAVGIPGGQWLTNDARAGMQRLEAETAPDRAAHPMAAGAGQFMGELALPGGAMAGGAKAGMNAFRTAAMGGGVGGLLNATGDENYWRDKAVGTGAGAAAGALAGKLGSAIAPAVRPNVQMLLKEGVQLTPGQLAGGAAKRVEDAAASVPVLGSQVRKAQQRSFETFNRAAINRSLSDIGLELPKGVDSGFNATGWAQDEFGKAYDAVIPRMVGILDNGLRNDLTALYAKAQNANLPREYLEQLEHAVRTHIIEPFRLRGGRITGTEAQKIGTMLDETINPLRQGNVYSQDLARYLREADKALDAMLQRQNPLLSAAKDKIDIGYAKFKTVQHATGKPGSNADGTFSPAQLFRSVEARDKSKDKAAFKRGDALMQDLANAARDVLPQKVPDSGTTERAALLGILGGGAHFIEPHVFAGLAAASVPYTAPASRALNAAASRLAPPAGPGRNFLSNLARLGGRALAPAAGSTAADAAMTVMPQQ